MVKAIPPLSFLRKWICGGCLLSRMPKPSSSCSMSFLCEMGLRQSSTMRIRLHVLAVLMTCGQGAFQLSLMTSHTWLDPDTERLVVTCLPRPLPSLAPSMMPGRSSSWTLAPLYRTTPGTQVRVVNS